LDSQRLGAILLRSGSITEGQLQGALAYRTQRRCRLGEALLSLGFCTEAQVACALAGQLGMPFIDLDETRPAREALELLSRPQAVQLGIVPVEVRPDSVLVVARNPFDFRLDAAARQAVGQPVTIACGVDAQILEALRDYDQLLDPAPPAARQPAPAPGEELEEANAALSRYLAAGGAELELEITDALVRIRGRRKSGPVGIAALPREALCLRIACEEGGDAPADQATAPKQGRRRLRATLNRA
jgi:hypothetical protein